MESIHNECVFSELFLNELEQVASQRISEKVLALKTVEKIRIIQKKMLHGVLIFNEYQRQSIFSFNIYDAMGCLDLVFQLSKENDLSSLEKVAFFANEFNILIGAEV